MALSCNAWIRSTEDPLDQLRQHRGLVAGPGTDLHDLVQRAGRQQQLGHPRHHEWLGNGLVVADRQGGVFVGAMRERLVDEQMTRRAADHLEHVGVGRAFFVQALDQALSGTLGRSCRYPGDAGLRTSRQSSQPLVEAAEGFVEGAVQLQRSDRHVALHDRVEIRPRPAILGIAGRGDQ